MKKKQIKIEYIYMIILLAGFLFRIIYSMGVRYNYSPHDIGWLTIDGKNGYGHLAYIQYIYENKSLPVEHGGQYYHPPLFYIVGAIVSAIHRVTDDYTVAMESLQNINMFMSCVGTIYAFKCVEKVCKKRNYLLAAAAFLSFHPCFMIIGAELNNDCFMTTFQIMALYYVMVWMDKPTKLNILKIAACIIAAMLSKTSGVLIAFAIGAIFFYYLRNNKNEWKKYLIQYGIFGIVCIPLGLSWCIFQKIRFGLPFNFICRMSESSEQFIRNVSSWQRLLFPYHLQLDYDKINFSDPSFHCNIWTQMFYTMNFDEGLILVDGDFIAACLYNLLFYSSIILYLILLCILISNMASKLVENKYKILIILNYFVIMIMFVAFAFDYSFICTMNFRYIAITPVLLIISYGLFCNRIKKRTIIHYAVISMEAVSCISTVILYLFYPVFQN